MINRYYDPQTGQFLSVDPAEGVTGQPYAAFGDNPISAQDPLGLMCAARPDGICTNPTTGALNLNTSAEPSDDPGRSGSSSQGSPSTSSTNGSLAAFAAAYENWIAEVNAAGAAFRAAAEKIVWAKFFANDRGADAVACSGTNPDGNPYDEDMTSCSWQAIAKAGGFEGCAIGPGGGSCPDQWNPIGQPVKVYNLQGAGTDWRVLGLSFASGCWEGAIATVESSPLGQVGACIAGGVVEAGLDAGGSRLLTGQY